MPRFHKLLSMMYDGLPVSVRNFIAPVLEPTYFTIKRIFSILSQLRINVYQFEGKSKWGEKTLTTLVIGEGSGMLPYVFSLLYADKPTKKKLDKIFLWKVKSKITSDIQSMDLVFVAIDEVFSRFLSRQGFVVIPEWVMFKLDLNKPLPKGNRSKGLQNNLRKVRKYQYSFEITRDFKEFQNFYHHMYLPYAENRYGELSLVGWFRDLQKIFERGSLLLVNRGNDCIAGALLQVKNTIVSVRYFGVKDGNVKYLEEGVLAACYYFTLTWAKDNGYEWIEFGHCRPFFRDGAFYHKKSWGMEIEKSNRLMLATKAVFGMKVCNHDHGLTEFLTTNPFITIDQGKLKGILFAQQEHPLTCEEIQSLYRTYYIPGIDSFVVSSSQGFTQEAEEFASSQSPQRLYLTV